MSTSSRINDQNTSHWSSCPRPWNGTKRNEYSSWNITRWIGTITKWYSMYDFVQYECHAISLQSSFDAPTFMVVNKDAESKKSSIQLIQTSNQNNNIKSDKQIPFIWTIYLSNKIFKSDERILTLILTLTLSQVLSTHPTFNMHFISIESFNSIHLNIIWSFSCLTKSLNKQFNLILNLRKTNNFFFFFSQFQKQIIERTKFQFEKELFNLWTTVSCRCNYNDYH